MRDKKPFEVRKIRINKRVLTTVLALVAAAGFGIPIVTSAAGQPESAEPSSLQASSIPNDKGSANQPQTGSSQSKSGSVGTQDDSAPSSGGSSSSPQSGTSSTSQPGSTSSSPGSVQGPSSGDNIRIAPYYLLDGNKSQVAKHIVIMTNNGVGDQAREAAVTGMPNPQGGQRPLQIWQPEDNNAAKLKVCVTDGQNTNSNITQRCVHNLSDAEGYGIASVTSSGSISPTQQVAESVPAISDNSRDTYVYIKLGTNLDQELINDHFVPGETVKIPVKRDQEPPARQKEVKALAPDGKSELDFANTDKVNIDSSSHTYNTDASGIVVEVTNQDSNPKPTNPPSSGSVPDSGSSSVDQTQFVSGPGPIKVTYEGKDLAVKSLITGTDTNQCGAVKAPRQQSCTYRFSINLNMLVQLGLIVPSEVDNISPISLSDFSITYYDQAGNASSPASLGSLAPFVDSDGNKVVEKVHLHEFPTQDDLTSMGFAAKVTGPGANPQSCVGTEGSNPCSASSQDPKLLKGKSAQARPVFAGSSKSPAMTQAQAQQKAKKWFAELSPFKPILTYTVTDQKGNVTSSPKECMNASGEISDNPCSATKFDDSNATDLTANLHEGEYNVSFSLVFLKPPRIGSTSITPFDTSKVRVLIDGTSPVAIVAENGVQKNDQNGYREQLIGSKNKMGVLAVASSDQMGQDSQKKTSFGFRLQDLLPVKRSGSSSPNPAAGANQHMNQNGTSGVAFENPANHEEKASIKWIYYDSFDEALKAASGKSHKQGHSESIPLSASEFDVYGNLKSDCMWTPNKEGAYLLSDMTIHVWDNAGNALNASLGKPNQVGGFSPGWGMLVVDGSNPDVSVVLKNTDKNAPASAARQYHRSSVSATIKITDKWFKIARGIQKQQRGRFLTAAIPNGADSIDIKDADFPAFTEQSDAADTWVSSPIAMPVNHSGSKKDRSVEGDYALSVSYRQISGNRIVAYPSTGLDRGQFTIDYTNPKFDAINFDSAGPDQWNWVFPESETINIATSDNVSGVCTSEPGQCGSTALPAFSGHWSQAGVSKPAYTLSSSKQGDRNAAMSIGFSSDGERLSLQGSNLTIFDKAGNSTTLNLGDTVASKEYGKPAPLLASNLAKGTTGIAIDSKTPTISVSFDNNSVRNGKYYKANRTATVTINESNFDFIKSNDKYRDVVVEHADGSQTTVPVDKFENPSGDNDTWMAQAPCDHDADWIFDVSLIDSAGHVALPYHSEFTIDTQKPLLEMKFDNNDAANGNYYKAVRTASIKQTERNFSPADTAVTVSAKDANGAAVASPVASPWSEASKDYVRTTSVAFTRELHYSITVTATDLAGNTAEAVEEPEFVIDLTVPKLSISQVADKTAYAGKVTPHIDFSDANFDPLFAQYKLTRTHSPDGAKKDQSAKRGKSDSNEVYLQDSQKLSPTSESVSLPDIEHTVDNDDVYTLEADVQDKAGNETKQQVKFSLNRFGSNYILDGATQNIVGRYIKVPQEVHVTEINVSGINFDKSHTELVHNQDVSQISLGKDYRMVSDLTSGWQEDTYDFPAGLFTSDGYYRLRLSSVDAAGNLSQNTMNKKNEARNSDAPVNFAVDQKLPEAGVDQLKSGSVTYAASRDLVVNAKDDVALKSAVLKVDGQTVGQWSGKKTLSPMSYRLNADQHQHEVQVISTDMAGNRDEVSYSGVVVATSWWSYMMARGYLLPGIFAGIVMIALIAICGVLIVRHRKDVAYRKNLFRSR